MPSIAPAVRRDRGARAMRQPLQSGWGFKVSLRCCEVGEKARGKGVAAAHRVDDCDGKARRPNAPFDSRQQRSACTKGDRDEASPRSPQARKTLLDIRNASHDGQLFLTDFEDIGLLGRFESDSAHFLLVPPDRRSQIDVDGDEDTRLKRSPHGVESRRAGNRLAKQQASDVQDARAADDVSRDLRNPKRQFSAALTIERELAFAVAATVTTAREVLPSRVVGARPQSPLRSGRVWR